VSSELIYAADYMKRLEPDQLGMFEPVSGMMLVNLSDEEYTQVFERQLGDRVLESDIGVLRAINHEVYHFAQTIASGYGYQRQRQLFEQIDHVENWAFLEERVAFREAEAELRNPVSKIWKVPLLLRQMELISKMTERAAPKDHSVVGAMNPSLVKLQQELAAIESEPNDEGLSIMAVLEGSAVVHTELLMGGSLLISDRLDGELSKCPPEYRMLLDLTIERCGDRALELILPTAALALRYTYPNNAFLPLLSAMANSGAGDALRYGRMLGADLPVIGKAGPILGTAIDCHPTVVYSSVLGELSSGALGVDSYSFLAEPEAMHRVKKFPIGLLLRDSHRLGSLKRGEFFGRLMIMSFVLHVHHRSRDENSFEEAIRDWSPSLFSGGS
jgi:hypothetical protein